MFVMLGASATPPRVLSYADIHLYQAIHASQARAQWQTADEQIARLDNPTLLGYVYAERYLHRSYQASYDDLHAWLEKYNDHPQAARIRRLALSKRTSGKPRPQNAIRPVLPNFAAYAEESPLVFDDRLRAPRMSRKDHATLDKFDVLPSKGAGAYARYRKTRFDTQRGKEAALGLVLRAMFLRNNDKQVIAAAHAYFNALGGADYSGFLADTDFLWWGGLSAWRAEEYDLALEWFRRVAYSPYTKEERTSAAAFWAWRSALRAGEFDQLDSLLDHAVHYPETFYGLIAAEVRGEKTKINFDIAHDVDPLVYSFPAAQRVLALFQVGNFKSTQAELKRFIQKVPPTHRGFFVDIAAEIGLTYYSYQTSWALKVHHNVVAESALYPVPTWEPTKGYEIDPALLFAIMRRESSFRPKIVSPVGARGLMQVMPATASLMLKRRVGNNELNDPVFNIDVAQLYFQRLLKNKTIKGNVFYAFAAYNAGPGNPYRWRRLVKYGNDPLLYVETIPITETRVYIHEVARNFWVYQIRMGQTPHTLRHVATGNWPIHRPETAVISADASPAQTTTDSN